MPRRSVWGWGLEGHGASAAERAAVAAAVAARFGVAPAVEEPVALDRVRLREPRVVAPPSLAGICAADPYQRALHAHGRSFVDVVRGFRGDFAHPPDVVAFPRTEADIVNLLDHCSGARVAVIPYGGGTSVVGGVEPMVGDGFAGVMTVDVSAMHAIRDVDGRSMAVHAQAGILGPALENGLRPLGLTVRHYPQSFELSTLGGWIATRSAGHHATARTHVEELIESVRMVTPAGILETRRLPASGAGPSPDRLVAGSEGALGVITEAWIRVQRRPVMRSSATLRFASFERGADAVQAVVQSGLQPSNCRLVDPVEALMGGVGEGVSAVLLLAFESAHLDPAPALAMAIGLCRDAGGSGDAAEIRHRRTGGGDEDPSGVGGGAAEAWRRSFLRAPYLRDVLLAMGMIVETFETAVTWDRFGGLHDAVLAAAATALRDAGAPDGSVSVRFTHVYPDGPAPYFTVIAPGRRGAEIEQWRLVKEAVSDAIHASGGTITHHHAVGRDHMAWYERERPPLFGEALVAAKARLDPGGILNPGVLVPSTAATERHGP